MSIFAVGHHMNHDINAKEGVKNPHGDENNEPVPDSFFIQPKDKYNGEYKQHKPSK